MEIPSKRYILFQLMGIIAFVELSIMLFFAVIDFSSTPYLEAFLDVFILISVCSPSIYFWIIKPYIHANNEVQQLNQHLACHDPLTDLANRRLLFEFLEKQLSSIRRHNLFAAILFIDLDDFKSINDKYGHHVGDTVLVESAHRLSSLVRNEDIVCRVGGDEFIIVLSHLDHQEKAAQEQSFMVAKKINQKLAEPIIADNVEYFITASIGVNLVSSKETNIETVLKAADNAMYREKLKNRENSNFAT